MNQEVRKLLLKFFFYYCFGVYVTKMDQIQPLQQLRTASSQERAGRTQNTVVAVFWSRERTLLGSHVHISTIRNKGTFSQTFTL